MIKTISYENIIIELRKTIMQYADLKPQKVMNALSIRGTELSDKISQNITQSFSAGDVFILFELLKDEDGDNYVTPKDDKNMISIASYKFHLMIYGNGSDNCSQVIRTIFKRPNIAMDLREKGIYVRSINSGETINEFINNTLLLRSDLELYIEVAYVLNNKEEPEYFSTEDFSQEDVMLTIKEV